MLFNGGCLRVIVLFSCRTICTKFVQNLYYLHSFDILQHFHFRIGYSFYLQIQPIICTPYDTQGTPELHRIYKGCFIIYGIYSHNTVRYIYLIINII